MTTSASVREYTVESAERGSESFSFQLRQNLTHRDCRHDNRGGRPETQELSMERVFVMYVTEERILRYAVTNKIGLVGGERVCVCVCVCVYQMCVCVCVCVFVCN